MPRNVNETIGAGYFKKLTHAFGLKVQESSPEQTSPSFVRFGKATGIRCNGAARPGAARPLGLQYAALVPGYLLFFPSFRFRILLANVPLQWC